MSYAVWVSWDVYPVYVFWETPEAIEVLVRGDGRARFGTIHSRSIDGITISTRVIRDSRKEAICRSEDLEEVKAKKWM